MKVTNKTATYTYDISMSQWGMEGDASLFKTKPGQVRDWGRDDWRCYVMVVVFNGHADCYMIGSKSIIEIFEDKITDHGNIIEPSSNCETKEFTSKGSDILSS